MLPKEKKKLPPLLLLQPGPGLRRELELAVEQLGWPPAGLEQLELVEVQLHLQQPARERAPPVAEEVQHLP